MNACDLWKFTPLHEAAAKGKFDICKLLMDNGGDVNKLNRDGQRPLDLVKESDDDVADLLRGEGEIFFWGFDWLFDVQLVCSTTSKNVL